MTEDFNSIICYLKSNKENNDLSQEDKIKFTKYTNKIIGDSNFLNLSFDEILQIIGHCNERGIESSSAKAFIHNSVEKFGPKQTFSFLYSLQVDLSDYGEAYSIIEPFIQYVPIIKGLIVNHKEQESIEKLQKENQELTITIELLKSQQNENKQMKSNPEQLSLSVQNKCKTISDQASRIIALEKEVSVLRTLPPLIEQSQKENNELKKMLFTTTKLSEGEDTESRAGSKKNLSSKELSKTLQPYISAKDLAEFDASLKKRREKGQSIHIAAYHNDIATMTYLLQEHPESVNDKTKHEGYTPLHIASGKGYDEMCLLLINGGKADINCRTLHQSTPLMRAILNEKTSTALILIDKGCNISLRNDHGENALLLAVKKKDKKVIEKLILKGCDIYEEIKNGESAVSLCSDEHLKKWMVGLYSSRKLI